jgi:hypothetical protein
MMNPNDNEEDAPQNPSAWMKFLMKISGVDEETLAQCPQHDWDNVRAIGEIMLCTWLYQTALFSLVGHLLFAEPGHFRIDLVLTAMFIATFIMEIDSYMVMRSGWHLAGIQELKRAGFDISGGQWARLKAGLFLSIRIILSVGLAQLTAIFVSLIIFSADIRSRTQDTYLKSNAHLVGPATALVDAGIQRATDAVAVQMKRVNALAGQIEALRQNEIDPSSGDPQVRQAQKEVDQLIERKAKTDNEVRDAETFVSNEYAGIKGAAGNTGVVGHGPRYRAALDQANQAKKRDAQLDKDLGAARQRLDDFRKQVPAQNDSIIQRSREQLPGFDQSLTAENTKLADLNGELAQLTAGREHAIRNAIEQAPDHVAADRGFLAQIHVLERMAEDDTKIALIILLIDVISFGFELAAVLVKVTSYVPTRYAALLAGNTYMHAVTIAEDLAGRLKIIEPKEVEILPPEPDFSAVESDFSATEPKHTTQATAAAPEIHCPYCQRPYKRGPGRPLGSKDRSPRKHRLPTVVTNSNGQAGPGSPSDRTTPA